MPQNMYLDHYHLNVKPFDLSPGPKFLWLGEKHKEALSTLNYGIMEDLGFLLLTGDVGVGKTALIHRLINSLDSSTIVAHITDPGLGTIDFFKLLAVEFNIAVDFYGKGEFLIELEKFLYAAYSDHKKVLLIVDEAQRLNSKLLDQIRVLSNIELSDRKLINIFFVGQPEFKTMLMANGNRAIRQRIAINYHINPLTESETGQYIEHRMKVAGATRKIFKPNAFREIFRFTGGFPRAINVICDHALVTGYVSGLNSIDSAVIKECEQELNIRAGVDFSWTDSQKPTTKNRPDTRQPAPSRSASMVYSILIGLCVVLIALVSYYLVLPTPRWITTLIPQKIVADASNPQTESVAKDQTQSAPKMDDTQRSAAPKNETAAAVRPPAIFTAQAKPAPDPLPYISQVDSGAMVPGNAEKKLAVQPVPSGADPGIQAEAAAPDKVEKRDVADPKDKIAYSDRPAESIAAIAPRPPDPLPGHNAPNGDVTAPGKATAAAAAVIAVLTTTEPELQADLPPQTETVAQDASPASEVDAEADSQVAVSAAKAAPVPDPPAETPMIDSPASTPGKKGANAAVVAVLAANKPSSPVKPGTSVGNVSAKPATNALKTGSTKKPSVIESESQAKAPPPSPIADESSKKAGSDNFNQAKKKTQPEQVSPDSRPEPPITAKAEIQIQPSSKRIGSIAPSAEKPDKNDLEKRLRSFLQNYCNTYSAKNFDAFTNLFIPDARENDTPFIRLLPKYKRNFEMIEAIEYQIDLRQFTYNEDMGTVNLDGDFFLRWLPPDKQWRENSGKISMSLQEKGPSFLVRRLDYQGGSAKKK